MEELLSKYFSRDASLDEIKSVEDWRSASEENAKVYLDYKKLWLVAGSFEKPNEAMLASILYDSSNGAPFEVIPLWNQKIFRIAAAVVIALGIVFTLMKNSSQNPYGEIVSEVTRFELPDGSIATLQRGGSISIGDFDQSRDVTLIGKAFFEVERNPDKPFIVNTKNAFVKVLGTSFLVNAPQEDNSVVVMVNSGQVSFSQNPDQFGNKALEIKILKGEMGIINLGEKGIKKKNLKDDNYLAWKTKQVNFRSTDLKEVSSIVEDMYGVKYEFESNSTMNCKLTAKFDQKSADEITELIAQTFGLGVEKNDKGYLLKGEGCR